MKSKILLALLVSLLFLTPALFSWAASQEEMMLYRFDGHLPLAREGFDTAGAGRLNADETPDFIVGFVTEATGDPGNIDSAHAYSGKTGSILFKVPAPAPSGASQNPVAGVGDLNHDKSDDVVVGTPGAKPAGLDEAGMVRAFSGKDGSLLWKVGGDNPGDLFGSAVARAGDVDGDGTPDVVVGVPGYAGGNGRAVVLDGATGELLCNVSCLGGQESFAHCGTSVDGVGDVNDDRRADIIVGAPFADSANMGTPDVGHAYVYSCQKTATLLWEFEGHDKGDLLGFSVSGPGDINSDSYPDFLIGAPRSGPTRPTKPGYAVVRSGKDGSELFRMNGEKDEDLFGHDVSSAGDFNGDGRTDFIIGAPQHPGEFGDYPGVAYVFSGKDASPIFRFVGEGPLHALGTAVDGAGDVLSNGCSEVIIGAPGSDLGGGAGSGSAYVFSCKEVPKPDIEVDPLSLDFGSLSPGDTNTKVTNVYNLGTATLELTSVNLIGGATPEFGIVSIPDTVLPPGHSTQIKLSYKPGALGIHGGRLRIKSNDPDEDYTDIWLTGRGAGPDIAVNPGSLAFGEQVIEDPSSGLVTFTNMGNETLTVSDIRLSASSSTDFSILDAPALPATLGPGHSDQIRVVYTPVEVGADSGSLRIISDDPDHSTSSVALSGSGRLPDNILPVAIIDSWPGVGRTWEFTGTNTFDTDGSIVSYNWDFGDGATSSAANPTHTYVPAGRYVVRLAVEDDRGGEDPTSIAVFAETGKIPTRSRFYGRASFTGFGVEEGTDLIAVIDGVEVAWAETQVHLGKSVYAIEVPSEIVGEGGSDGDTVRFWIGDSMAMQSGTWVSKSDQELDLNAWMTAVMVMPDLESYMESPSGYVYLEFPARMVGSATEMLLTEIVSPTVPMNPMLFAEMAFLLEATDPQTGAPVVEFDRPFRMEVSYEEEQWQQAGIVDESTLSLYTFDEQSKRWQGVLPCQGCQLDTQDNVVQVVLDHLTQFAMAGDSSDGFRVYSPLILHSP